MSPFTERQRTLDTYWRSIILFGQNVASYKFALAQSLIDLSETRSSAVSLEQLAAPFSRHLSEHSKAAAKQTTSRSSRYLETCKRYDEGQLTSDDLVAATVKLGFNNVVDAFHASAVTLFPSAPSWTSAIQAAASALAAFALAMSSIDFGSSYSSQTCRTRPKLAGDRLRLRGNWICLRA